MSHIPLQPAEQRWQPPSSSQSSLDKRPPLFIDDIITCLTVVDFAHTPSFFRPFVITLPSHTLTTFENILSSAHMDSFEEFGSTFGSIMMFRRVVFSLGLYPLFFPFHIPQTFSFQPGVATGDSFCSWGVLVRPTSPL